MLHRWPISIMTLLCFAICPFLYSIKSDKFTSLWKSQAYNEVYTDDSYKNNEILRFILDHLTYFSEDLSFISLQSHLLSVVLIFTISKAFLERFKLYSTEISNLASLLATALFCVSPSRLQLASGSNVDSTLALTTSLIGVYLLLVTYCEIEQSKLCSYLYTIVAIILIATAPLIHINSIIFPIFGSFLQFLALCYGLTRKSERFREVITMVLLTASSLSALMIWLKKHNFFVEANVDTIKSLLMSITYSQFFSGLSPWIGEVQSEAIKICQLDLVNLEFAYAGLSSDAINIATSVITAVLLRYGLGIDVFQLFYIFVVFCLAGLPRIFEKSSYLVEVDSMRVDAGTLDELAYFPAAVFSIGLAVAVGEALIGSTIPIGENHTEVLAFRPCQQSNSISLSARSSSHKVSLGSRKTYFSHRSFRVVKFSSRLSKAICILLSLTIACLSLQSTLPNGDNRVSVIENSSQLPVHQVSIIDGSDEGIVNEPVGIEEAKLDDGFVNRTFPTVASLRDDHEKNHELTRNNVEYSDDLNTSHEGFEQSAALGTLQSANESVLNSSNIEPSKMTNRIDIDQHIIDAAEDIPHNEDEDDTINESDVPELQILLKDAKFSVDPKEYFDRAEESSDVFQAGLNDEASTELDLYKA